MKHSGCKHSRQAVPARTLKAECSSPADRAHAGTEGGTIALEIPKLVAQKHTSNAASGELVSPSQKKIWASKFLAG